ncbi:MULTISPECIES: BLUF domain-containing protein [Microbacterium]|uniref:Photopigment and puc expression activator n=1 Tax=Microbacterium oleivorans TaxID=273677 RepID=A0A031FU06_9MICO|nr:BLUF domain-containing protein [Microbacterium oleivorans]EZP28083.1 Photopigment and puc expression activator [Microbacterium oleivorans]
MTATDETVFSVVYSSTATEPMDDDALRELLEQCRASNAERDVTGMLLYRNGRFIQILEGPEQAVRETMGKIERDPRHDRLRVLIDEFIDERHFAEWTMGYEAITTSHGDAPEGFRDTFDDLEGHGDPSATLRAARELSLWFRVRSGLTA